LVRLSLLSGVISYLAFWVLHLRRMKLVRLQLWQVRATLRLALDNMRRQQRDLVTLGQEQELLVEKYGVLCKLTKEQAPQVWNSYVALLAKDRPSKTQEQAQTCKPSLTE
jgi:hypothetical protein